jgi:hypothetical protein
MIEFTPHNPSVLGYILEFLSSDDPRPARVQFNSNYIGGWSIFDGFTLNDDNSLSYPNDPDLQPLCTAKLRDETIVVYRYAWVAIIQPDRSYEIARLD